MSSSGDEDVHTGGFVGNAFVGYDFAADDFIAAAKGGRVDEVRDELRSRKPKGLLWSRVEFEHNAETRALMAACEAGQLEVVRVFFEQRDELLFFERDGANLYLETSYLGAACRSNNIALVEYLVSHKFRSFDDRADATRTALNLVSARGKNGIAMARALVVDLSGFFKPDDTIDVTVLDDLIPLYTSGKCDAEFVGVFVKLLEASAAKRDMDYGLMD